MKKKFSSFEELWEAIEDDLGYNDTSILNYNEAEKGEQAALCENDLYNLKGTTDPMAVRQNLSNEIEKLMRIFPNTSKVINE
jgi:hypothetical protein